MQWYNEPPVWQILTDGVQLTTGAQTDFWRKTHYGFIRDNGHFYYQTVTGDFTATVKITGQYQVLYDQAGLMVRENEMTWLKCGIEFVESVQNVSAVVTRDFSDWSVVPLLHPPASLWLRLHRRAEAIEIQYSLDGTRYQLLRLTHLTHTNTLDVGIMAASPQGDGCKINFSELTINPSE